MLYGTLTRAPERRRALAFVGRRRRLVHGVLGDRRLAVGRRRRRRRRRRRAEERRAEAACVGIDARSMLSSAANVCIRRWWRCRRECFE